MNWTSYLPPMAWASALALAAMIVTWAVGKALRNYGIVDAVWSYLFAPVAGIYAVLGTGAVPRRALLAAMVGLWSLRLGTHLTRRIAGDHPTEDRRYASLRSEWGSRVDRRMLGFYLLQGLLVIVLSVPFLLPAFNASPPGHFLEWTGIGVFALGLGGESLADAQLSRFKKSDAAGVCEIGLWRYSRHPNYFFEWLIWVGFATFALPSPGGWLGLVAPLMMLHFLLNVTGIPMAEELSVARKGDAYRRYQETTSRFVPWPRKET